MRVIRWLVFLGSFLAAHRVMPQSYVVNSNNDMDDGICNAVHCSFREAINAANADGVPSLIQFNIPGPGPHSIVPTGIFPDVTDNALTIIGESQPGPLGSIVIDFANTNFGGRTFWNVLASDVYISGLTFSNFRYVLMGDEVIRVGSDFRPADRFSIVNCAFTNDNLTGSLTVLPNVHIYNSEGALVRKNIFGSDYSKANINLYLSALHINQLSNTKRCVIDSNLFVTSRIGMVVSGGDLYISKNIFGALDTSKAQNLNTQQIGIQVLFDGKYLIDDNFFIYHLQASIQCLSFITAVQITNNRFYNFVTAISLMSSARIFNNFAANVGAGFLGAFISVNGSIPGLDFDIESNFAFGLQNFYLIRGTMPNLIRSKHAGNRIFCNENNPVIIGPSVDAIKPPSPVIVRVNRNLIEGRARPNDSVSVYVNNRQTCPSADCRGGVEIGRTVADANGNWSLAAAVTAGISISAYVWNRNDAPLIYSEFSPCYRCTANAPIVISAGICEGETFTFRNRVYDDSKTKDTIIVRGDGVNVCDSVFHINLTVSKPSYQIRRVDVCYGDTLRIAGIQLYEGKLIDSVKLKGVNNCDSNVTFIGTLRGYRALQQSICSNSSITVGNTVFDKNNTSGRVRLPGQAAGGCDSIIDVRISIKEYAEHFINITLCPGQSIVINGVRYDANKTSGTDTLKGASASGCDSVVHVNVVIPNTTGSYSVTICRSDSVFIVKEYFSARKPSGQIICKAGEACASVYGCDSIINVSLDFIPDAMGFYRANICRGDTITLPGFPGEKFFSGRTNGTLKMVNSAANGCDSIIQVNLTVLPDAIGAFDTVLCENQGLNLYGNQFDKNRPSATIRVKNLATTGCDSFIMVRIQFTNVAVGNFNPTLCRKDSVRAGKKYFSANNPIGRDTLLGASVAGCDSVVIVNVNVVPDILVNFRTADLLCNAPNSGRLIIDQISGGSGNWMVSIDQAAPVPYQPGMVFPNLAQGRHVLKIVDQTGCDATSEFAINNSRTLSLNLPRDTTIKRGTAVDLAAKLNFNPSFISWTPASFLSCTSCLNPVSRPDNTITYTLTLRDEDGCEIQDRVTIYVIVDEAEVYFPTVFSPNGDQINDTFFPVFKFPEKTKINSFRIFDRWGELVFERSGGIVGEIFEWNGTYASRQLLPGVYVYTIQFEGEDRIPKNRKGNVTLLR